MNKFIKAIFFFLFFSTLPACKKDNSLLSTDVQPGYDLLNAELIESQPITMYSERVDSVISYDDPFKFLGSNQDQYFGRTDIGLYVNTGINVTNLNFGADTKLSSSEIILEVASTEYTGDAATIMTYSVFSLDSTIQADRSYYTSQKNLHNANNVVAAYTGSYTTIDGKVVLRIPVDTAFASFILRNPQFLTDNATFQAKYKGFYITAQYTNLNPTSSQGIISLFNLNSALSGLYLRYKKTPTSAEESYKFNFDGDNISRYNTVTYQPYQGANSMLIGQLQGDTLIGNQNTFLKGLAGTIVKVNIPGLNKLADSSYVSVNRADVVFTIDNAFKPASGKYNPPPILSLIPLDSTGKESLGGHSYNVSNLSKYDGKYNESTQQYTFDISRFVQLLMRGSRKNYGFHLVVADPDITKVVFRDDYINRVAFHGLNKYDLRPRCNLYYVKMDAK